MGSHLDVQTLLYVLEDLDKVRARYIDPEALDKMAISELEFAVSPHDLLYNLIEVKRAKRAVQLGMFGQPRYRDMKIELVSDQNQGCLHHMINSPFWIPSA